MYILYDIGATKMRVAATESGESFTDPVIVQTPQKYEEGVAEFTNAARLSLERLGASSGGNVEAIVGGMAGSIDAEKGMLYNSPHLTDWNCKPFKYDLETTFSTDFVVENDADIVGLGEAVYGAAKDAEISAYITVSTGVGGGRYVDGRIDRNRYGFEPGLQIVDIEGSVWPDVNKKGTLEGLVSGTALKEKFGVEPYKVREEGIWDTLAERLAVGVHNTMLHWSPDVVVLGGSMITGDPCITFERTCSRVRDIMTHFAGMPEIRKAELGVIGGLYGAMAYVNRHLAA